MDHAHTKICPVSPWKCTLAWLPFLYHSAVPRLMMHFFKSGRSTIVGFGYYLLHQGSVPSVCLSLWNIPVDHQAGLLTFNMIIQCVEFPLLPLVQQTLTCAVCTYTCYRDSDKNLNVTKQERTRCTKS